ncbi:UBX domain-containing protein 1/4 [Entomortierella parvispora]|uniref:UBX domain-containing protein 1/4 n=1 Tax=Entomortierella parvispora TaxID=205924 RepID=A0A9P3HEZ8_9FUNG|nr:UBX domain-containing protein 1/4 [Entomortierella parvispora]
MASDADQLVEMGFPRNRVIKAMRATKNAGLQPAMDWLVAHSEDADIDDPIQEHVGGALGAASSSSAPATGDEDSAEKEGDVIQDGEQTAQSLICQDCQMILRDADAAQRHAMRTEHVNFAESTTVIKPLTEEEKQAKLAELKQRLAEKRAAKAQAEKEDQKMSEKIRRKAGQDLTEVKARLEEKEMKKLVEAKKREKEQDRLAKLAIKARIEADKAERARKKQEATLGFQQAAEAATAQAAAEAAAKAGPPKVYTETRLQIRTTGGQPVVHTFQATDKLSAVYDFMRQHQPGAFKLMTTFPRKVLDGAEMEKTLNELQLVPSGTLAVTLN